MRGIGRLIISFPMTLTRLRPISSDDHPFLFNLHTVTMKDLIDRTWGWDEIWQREDFQRRVKRCRVSMIEVETIAVGALYVELLPQSIYITDLQILPEWQGHGIGAAVVKEIVHEAASAAKATELAVLRLNRRAGRLYERLGFVATGVDEPFIYMRHDSQIQDLQR